MSVAYFDSVDFPSKDSFLYNRHSIRWLQIACLTYLVVKGNYSNLANNTTHATRWALIRIKSRAHGRDSGMGMKMSNFTHTFV